MEKLLQAAACWSIAARRYLTPGPCGKALASPAGSISHAYASSVCPQTSHQQVAPQMPRLCKIESAQIKTICSRRERAVIRFDGRLAGKGKMLMLKRPLKDLPRLEIEIEHWNRLIPNFSQTSWKYTRWLELLFSMFEDIMRKYGLIIMLRALKLPRGNHAKWTRRDWIFCNWRSAPQFSSRRASSLTPAHISLTFFLPLEDPGCQRFQSAGSRKNPPCQLQYPFQQGRRIEQLWPESPTRAGLRGFDRYG